MYDRVHWMSGTRLRGGEDFPRQLKEELVTLPRPVLFVFDPVPVAAEEPLRAVYAQVPERMRWDRPARTPTVGEVRGAAREWSAAGAAAVVAVGGGSTLDFAKAAAHCMRYPDAWERDPSGGLVFPTAWEPPHVPVVAVPTTVGTGSELNGKAVVDYGGRRRLVFHWGMYPQAAIVHPDLFRAVPWDVLMGGALETLARLVVPAASERSPFAVADALAAAQAAAVLEAVGRLRADPGGPRARHDLAMTTATSVLTLHQLGRSPYSYWLWYLVTELNNHGFTKRQALGLLLPLWVRLVREGGLPGAEALAGLDARAAALGAPGLTEALTAWGDAAVGDAPAAGGPALPDADGLTAAVLGDWGEGLAEAGIGGQEVRRVFTGLDRAGSGGAGAAVRK
ncbi:iron-containing alcohol dehydrogenase [Nocardiopsis suaedae]|uniref:Iron-containing alcohol dehydrogenase n=1 Tax=Nocardiopsis suaedae TaxID=3018444 RepID=A0ABT4TIY6_9ACTN|nr:iron-containing alcohol dehydrogenase [Nocardiopsis suaedae]MDA2804670.1 iron-containing alcohol dehydrogenase [Nocardiopsis suaedae]